MMGITVIPGRHAEGDNLVGLVLDKLVHVGAAAAIVERITAQVADAIEDAVIDFCNDAGWEGGPAGPFRFAVCPPQWRELEVLGGIMRAKFAFALTPASDEEEDRFLLSALTGKGQQRAVLRWEREPCGSATRLAKLIAKQRDMVAQLTAMGFERNEQLGGGFQLPLLIDIDALKRELAGEMFEEATAPIVTALRTARVAAPLFKPLMDWIEEELDR